MSSELIAVDENQAGLLRDRLAVVFQAIPDFVLLADAHGRIDYLNPAARQALGISPDEDVRHTCLADYQPSSHGDTSTKEAMALAAQTGTWTGESFLVRRDGTQIAVLLTIVIQKRPEGNVEYVSMIARDISEQKAIARRFHTRALALEAVSEGILVTAPWRRDNPILYVNPAFERIAGYRAHEVIGRSCDLLLGEHTDRQLVDQIHRATLEQRPLKCELLVYRADGTSFWSVLSLMPLRDEQGSVLYFLVTVADISHRRQLEEHLRQSQKMDSIGRLAAGVAHDFNNLLTVIMGSAERAAKLLSQTSSPTVECIQDISAAAERAAALTRQLLAFSRKQLVIPRPIDIDVLIENCGGILRRLMGESIVLELALGAGPARVMGDQSQFEQVVLNLAVNARDAMPDGGHLCIRTRFVELDIEYVLAHPDAQPGSHVCVEVSDTGIGIPPEVAPHLFEPFFTTKKLGEGTGMGLATVYGIVKQSEGHIVLESEMGRGTTFRIFLPCVSEELSAGGGDKEEQSDGSGHETVLIVEDEESVLRVATHFLRESGYQVLTANDGASACEVARRHASPIDLLVVDVVMPGINGHEVAQRIAEMRPSIKILYVSGYTDSDKLRRSISAREVNFLPKPYDQHTLSQKVRQVLDAAQRG